MNLSKVDGEIVWKKKLIFKTMQVEDLHEKIEKLKSDETTSKFDPRFIVVTDFVTMLAIDRKTSDILSEGHDSQCDYEYDLF